MEEMYVAEELREEQVVEKEKGSVQGTENSHVFPSCLRGPFQGIVLGGVKTSDRMNATKTSPVTFRQACSLRAIQVMEAVPTDSVDCSKKKLGVEKRGDSVSF